MTKTKNTIKNHHVRISFLTLATLLPSWAGILSSSTIEVDHYYPDLGLGSVIAQPSTWTSPQVTQTITTGSTTPSFHVYSNISFTDSTITFTLPGGSLAPFTFNTVAFNGIRFFDVTGNIPAFTNVTVQATGGLNLANLLTSDGNGIALNFQSLTTNGNVVTLTVGGSTVPEPASFLLSFGGLAGLAILRRWSLNGSVRPFVMVVGNLCL